MSNDNKKSGEEVAMAPESPSAVSNQAMIWWCIATLVSLGAAWLLLKGGGRPLVGAPGEILITISRPAAIEAPYPVQDLKGWGTLMLGELPSKYGRMTLLFGLWTAGCALFFCVLLGKLRTVGMSTVNRVLITLAGLAAFGAGVRMLQAEFRSIGVLQSVAGVGGLDPFRTAELLPLNLATMACIFLALASMLLAAGVGMTLRQKAVKGFAPPSYRVTALRLATVGSFVFLVVLTGYAAKTLYGAIPNLMEIRLDVLNEASVVRQLRDMLAGLRWSAVCVQLGGLLWVVAAWVAPGTARN